MTELRVRRGDDLVAHARVVFGQGRNEQPQPIGADWRFWMTIKRSVGDEDLVAIAQATRENGGIVVDSAIGGLLTATIGTAGFPLGALVWDLQAKDDLGRVKTLDSGVLRVLEDVTLGG